MKDIKHKEANPVFCKLGNQAVALDLDTNLYALPSIFRACYKFTDRCYIFLTREIPRPSSVIVTLSTKLSGGEIDAVLGDFCNELIDQQIREDLSLEAGALREMIVAQAFSEGNLLDPQRDDGDYEEDPLGIGQRS